MANLSLVSAERALLAGRAKAIELGVSCTITVIDAGGHLVAMARMDSAVLASIETSYTKAKASVWFAAPTVELWPDVQPGGPMFGISHSLSIPLALLPGGVPVLSEGILVGGIGVGGAASSQDHDIAVTARAAL